MAPTGPYMDLSLTIGLCVYDLSALVTFSLKLAHVYFTSRFECLPFSIRIKDFSACLLG